MHGLRSPGPGPAEALKGLADIGEKEGGAPETETRLPFLLEKSRRQKTLHHAGWLADNGEDKIMFCTALL